MEVIYAVIAVATGWLLYRYFGGHGGLAITRTAYGGLPLEGEITVRGRAVRWTATDADTFAAAWPMPSGDWVAIRVVFDTEPNEEGESADLGRLDVTVMDRPVVRGVRWTDQIRDRGLRADVEAVLGALGRRARQERSSLGDASAAKPVGTRPELE